MQQLYCLASLWYNVHVLKSLFKFLSDVFWRLGAERLSLRFLLLSLETTNVITPTIDIKNTVKAPLVVPRGPWNMEVVYVDEDLIKELGQAYDNDIKIPKHVNDVN